MLVYTMLVGLVEELAVDEASSCMVDKAFLPHLGHKQSLLLPLLSFLLTLSFWLKHW